MPPLLESWRSSLPAQPYVLYVAACLIVPSALAWALTYLAELFLPLLSAVFLLLVLSPPARALQRLGIGELWAYFIAAMGTVAAVLSIGVMLYAGVADFETRVPEYGQRLYAQTEQWITSTPVGRQLWEQGSANEMLKDAPSAILRWSFGSLFGFLGGFIAMIFYLVFLLLEQHTFPDRLRRAFPNGSVGDGRAIAKHVEADVRTYVWVKTVVSLGTGVTTALGLALIGLDFWVVWGLLAFVMNYVPYVGSLVASVPPLILAFLQFGSSGQAWGVLAVVIGNQLFWDYYLTPRMTGQRLNLSPLLIVLALAYFGLVWGVIGMVLSVPLLLGVRELLARFEPTRPLAALMSTPSESASSPQPASASG